MDSSCCCAVTCAVTRTYRASCRTTAYWSDLGFPAGECAAGIAGDISDAMSGPRLGVISWSGGTHGISKTTTKFQALRRAAPEREVDEGAGDRDSGGDQGARDFPGLVGPAVWGEPLSDRYGDPGHHMEGGDVAGRRRTGVVRHRAFQRPVQEGTGKAQPTTQILLRTQQRVLTETALASRPLLADCSPSADYASDQPEAESRGN